MLTHQQLETVRAALRYWADEICPHGPPAAMPYYDGPPHSFLDTDAIHLLADRFREELVRYVRIDPANNILLDTKLYDSNLFSQRAGLDPTQIGTIILPPKVV